MSTDWRVKTWHKVDGRLKIAEPPFMLEVEFDKPVIDLRHGELTGKGYTTVEEALQDGISQDDIKAALGGDTVRVQVRVSEWEPRKPVEPTGNQLSGNESDSIEAMIDKHGLGEVISAIAVICFEKADHLRSNWQDERTAKVWDNAGKAVERAERSVSDVMR